MNFSNKLLALKFLFGEIKTKKICKCILYYVVIYTLSSLELKTYPHFLRAAQSQRRRESVQRFNTELHVGFTWVLLGLEGRHRLFPIRKKSLCLSQAELSDLGVRGKQMFFYFLLRKLDLPTHHQRNCFGGK